MYVEREIERMRERERVKERERGWLVCLLVYLFVHLSVD